MEHKAYIKDVLIIRQKKKSLQPEGKENDMAFLNGVAVMAEHLAPNETK
jgi:7,8-dihydro-6-hydroxymethylpterin-pyrophosphokinase